MGGSPSARVMGKRASMKSQKHARFVALAARLIERVLLMAGSTAHDARAVCHLVQRRHGIGAARAALQSLPPLPRAALLFVAALTLSRALPIFLAAAAFGALFAAATRTTTPDSTLAEASGSSMLYVLRKSIARTFMQSADEPDYVFGSPDASTHDDVPNVPNPIAYSQQEQNAEDSDGPWAEAFTRARGTRGYGYVEGRWEGVIGVVASFRSGFYEGRTGLPESGPKPLQLSADGSSFAPTDICKR